jgi:hypothetical protein
MKELIEEIKTLKIADKARVPDNETIEDYIKMSSHNHAIDEVVKIIESYKPKVLNKPEPNIKTKEDRPFKHLRAIPIVILHTKTKELNPFIAGNGNQNKPLPKPDNKINTEKELIEEIKKG